MLPHRRHRLRIDLSADDHDQLLAGLRLIADEIDKARYGEVSPTGVQVGGGMLTSGGQIGNSYHLMLQTDQRVTASSYQEALKGWFDRAFPSHEQRHESEWKP